MEIAKSVRDDRAMTAMRSGNDTILSLIVVNVDEMEEASSSSKRRIVTTDRHFL